MISNNKMWRDAKCERKRTQPTKEFGHILLTASSHYSNTLDIHIRFINEFSLRRNAITFH